MENERKPKDLGQVAKPYAVLLLCIVSVLINFLGAQLALWLKLPLFLDTIGTVLSAALGGFLPGIAVGFVTNLINSFADASSAYYGALNVLIAVAAVLLYRRGSFNKLPRLWLPVIVFALIGGALSSVIAWLLSGMNIGDGISAGLATRMYENGVDPFIAQLVSGFAIDVVDKIIVCMVVFILLKVLPKSLKHRLLVSAWQQAPLSEEALAQARSHQTRSVSLRAKVLLLLTFATVLTILPACAVSFVQYRQTTISEHIKLGENIAKLEAGMINPDRVDDFLTLGEAAEGYKETEAVLYNILHSTTDIQYVYVYRILSDGCHVVFDLDTDDLEGGEPGDVVEFDESFRPYLPDLLAGRPIEPIISDDKYGWLLTAYEPVYNSAGECVCYAATDISMGMLTQEAVRFLVKVVTLTLGFIILVLAAGLWLSEYNLILPINSMSYAAGGFAYTSDEDRSSSVEHIRQLGIRTGDEIENLYHALAKTTEDSMRYIADIQQHSATISKMQNGLILVLADMVESRDKCTGDHVRKTAAYADVIMQELKKEGKFTDVLTDEYIQDVVHSAPLHDVGKIQVSDVLLNKPGRLTDEEFHAMQYHTTAGGEIISHAIALVSDAGYLAEAKNLASYHHERWDGKGYPCGLSGDQIPLSARIMAVADVFDALVSRRSYKDPFPFEKAMDIIREESGTHFDPDVAQAFLNAEGEVRRIEEEFSRASMSRQRKKRRQRMEQVFERPYLILPSVCGADGRLSLHSVFALFMDFASQHAQLLGNGPAAMAGRDLFWLTVKTQIRFFELPRMMETVTARTWPEAPGKVRCDRSYQLLRGGQILAAGKTEWAVLNTKTGQLAPLADVYPAGLSFTEPSACPGPYARIVDAADGWTQRGDYTVRSTDIDLGGHMNNAAYVRALLGSFSNAELGTLAIRQMDVIFRTPCYEGETLSIEQRPAAGGTELRLTKPEGTALLVQIKSE